MSSTTDKNKAPIIVKKALDWSTTFNLSEAQKNIRFVGDGEGHIWAYPVVLVDPSSSSTPLKVGSNFSIKDPTTDSQIAGVRYVTNDSNDASILYSLAVHNYNLDLDYQSSTGWFRHRGCYGKRQVSAVNTANILSDIYVGNLHDVLAIYSVASAGTATLTVEVSVDDTNWITLDSVAAAASIIKIYGATTAATTLALPPAAFQWLKVTAGTAGAGNTTTLTVAYK